MSEILNEFIRKRRDLDRRINELQKQRELLDEMIYEAETGTQQKKKEKITKAYLKSEVYMSTIKRLLSEDNLGRETKYLHNVIEAVTGETLNYNTFRSYLNRMKKRKEIFQDKNKNWRLKE